MVSGDLGPGEGLLTVAAAFAERAERADGLAAAGGPAAHLLRFAADLLRLQGGLAEDLGAAHALRPLQGSPLGDAAALAPRWDAFLGRLRGSSAPAVAGEATRLLASDGAARWEAVVGLWQATGPTDAFVVRAFLRPYAETLRESSITIARERREGYCPVCGAPPSVSLRRTVAESQAGHRYLVCSLCGGDWPTTRIRCPLCQEADPVKLPVYSSERHPGARLETCDTCRHYVKSIDLTLDGRAIPEVDDLLSVALDLWAAEQGYRRIEPGIAGV